MTHFYHRREIADRTINCPCTWAAQCATSPKGFPSLLCACCDGLGVVTLRKWSDAAIAGWDFQQPDQMPTG